MPSRLRRAATYAAKWPHYHRNSLPWRRMSIHREFMRRNSFIRFPVDGNLLDAFRENRIELGDHVVVEPNVWIDVLGSGRLSIGAYTTLNSGVMLSVIDRLEIGEHCLFARGCFITDADHRFSDPIRPVPWQGMLSKGPTVIGDNVWFGANAVVLSGVTIGRRCVVGAGAVVTSDLPPHTVCVGVPARPVKEIEYSDALLPPVDLQGGWR